MAEPARVGPWLPGEPLRLVGPGLLLAGLRGPWLEVGPDARAARWVSRAQRAVLGRLGVLTPPVVARAAFFGAFLPAAVLALFLA